MPTRRRLPDTRKAITHTFYVDGTKGYIRVGLFADGSPGEVFLHIEKEGSTIAGMARCFALLLSLALQHDIPFVELAAKFRHQRFEPSGLTRNKDIPMASSIIDYIFAWMQKEFYPSEKA